MFSFDRKSTTICWMSELIGQKRTRKMYVTHSWNIMDKNCTGTGNRISANEHIAIKVPRVPLSVFALPPMSRTIVSSALFVWQNWMLMCYSEIHVTCLHDEFTASR